MDSHDRPIWEQVLRAAQTLATQSVEFRLNDLVKEVQRLDPSRGRTSIHPVVQGMTVNAGKGPSSPCGKPLVRVEHGLYRLLNGSPEEGEIDFQRKLQKSPSLNQPSKESRREIVEKRVQEVIGGFVNCLDAYDSQVPFTRNGQYSWHRATIDRRLSWPTVRLAVQDEVFVDDLYEVLQVWGIGRRASRLLPRDQFGERLIAVSAEIGAFENLRLEDPELDVESIAKKLWQLLERLKIVDNISLIVPGTKTLHHLLPNLVPPMDRAWTGNFFKWSATAPQYEQEKTFIETFSYFAKMAQSTNPAKFVGEGWRSSTTKLLDNAIIGYSKLHGLIPGVRTQKNEKFLDDSKYSIDPNLTRTNVTNSAPEIFPESLERQELVKNDPTRQNSLDRGHIEFQEDEKGISYNFLFGSYVQNVKQIQIIDPYVRYFAQIRNLMEFIETVREFNPKDSKVNLKLLTAKDEDAAKAMNQLTLLNQVKKSAIDYGVEFSFDFDQTRTIHDRSITSDNGWKIILGRGLDIYQSISNDRFSGAYRIQELRKVRRFGVTYVRSPFGAEDTGN